MPRIYFKTIMGYKYQIAMTDSAKRKELYKKRFNVYEAETNNPVFLDITFKDLKQKHDFDGRHLYGIILNYIEPRSVYFHTYYDEDKNNRVFYNIETWYNGKKYGVFENQDQVKDALGLDKLECKDLSSYIRGTKVTPFLNSDPRPLSRNYRIEYIKE